jgi:hypothetical protein
VITVIIIESRLIFIKQKIYFLLVGLSPFYCVLVMRCSDLRCFVCYLAAAQWLLSLFLVFVLRHPISLLQFLFYWPDLLSSLLDQRILLIFFCHV